jgi:hypothetical protein
MMVRRPKSSGVGELGHDHALRSPAALDDLHASAAHQELAATLLDGGRYRLPVLLERRGIGDVDVDDEVGGHRLPPRTV